MAPGAEFGHLGNDARNSASAFSRGGLSAMPEHSTIRIHIRDGCPVLQPKVVIVARGWRGWRCFELTRAGRGHAAGGARAVGGPVQATVRAFEHGLHAESAMGIPSAHISPLGVHKIRAEAIPFTDE